MASGIDLSGLTPQQAAARLDQLLPSFRRRAVRLQAADKWIDLTAADLGASWAVVRTVDSAFQQGRQGSSFQKLIALADLMRRPESMQVPVYLDHDRMLLALRSLASRVRIRPRDASLRFISGVPIVSPSVPGRRMDLDVAAKELTSVLQSGPNAQVLRVDLPVALDDPEVSTEMLAGIDGVVGHFTTYYHPYQRARTHNLWLAATAIDGAVVPPGQVFGYNRRVGKRTTRRGYESAPIFVKGKVIDDTGGGICQVATTLYNAALLSNLHIVERNRHSMRTSYIQPGRDATVAWSGLDLRFRNTSSSAVVIKVSMGGGELGVNIWGHRRLGQHVKVYTRNVKDGIITYRVVTDADGETFRQIVSRDPYPERPVE
jgi:vancomycin resistance protein YoaR